MRTIGDGDGVLVHSRSTYRVRGRIMPVEPRDALLFFETKRLIVAELECVEAGSGPCEAYPGLRVPPTGDGSSWVPILPDSAKGKVGVFVQNGLLRCRAEMMKTPSRKEPVLIPAIRSVGSIKMNEIAEWAKPAD